jgi:hypothetical protein
MPKQTTKIDESWIDLALDIGDFNPEVVLDDGSIISDARKVYLHMPARAYTAEFSDDLVAQYGEYAQLAFMALRKVDLTIACAEITTHRDER